MVRILVVEDEPDVRDLVRATLELAGHDVAAVATGAEALRAVAAHPPDLVVLDVVLPGLDGWQVLAELKRAPVRAVAEVPVVVLSAQTGDIDRIRAGIEGAIRYVTKPFSVADLHRQVDEALAGGPEPDRRRRARADALGHLARLEGERKGPDPGAADEQRAAPPPAPRHQIGADGLAGLSPRQREVLLAVACAGTVGEAAARLGVSRTSVYANLRRCARRLRVPSVPQLLDLARSGAIEPPA